MTAEQPDPDFRPDAAKSNRDADRLARIIVAIGETLHPADLAWALPRLAPRSQQRAQRLSARDAAVREALALLCEPRSTVAACALQRLLARHVGGSTWRAFTTGRDLPEMTDIDKAIHHIARTNRGRTLGWRQIANIGSGRRG